MKFLVSYFYQIRFFRPNQIPVSTAIFDPQWYHEFRGPEHCFIDRRGVINGLRAPDLNPQTSECTCCENKTEECDFKRHYLEHLRSLGFKEYTELLEEGIAKLSRKFNIQDPEIVLIVHEAPDNPCSERWELIKWFNENGQQLEEFKKKVRV